MDFDSRTATALMWALGLAREHCGAKAALRASGVDLPEAERFGGLAGEVEDLLGESAADAPVTEALALGFLAGRVASNRPRARARTGGDPTSFVMDRDLVVQGAEGESIMRLPWFEQDLFVGRQVPDIAEMPTPVRKLCIENYSAALRGNPTRFAFRSYGHAYSVDAIPVNGECGRTDAVLAVATPAASYGAAAAAYERTAERLAAAVSRAEERAELHRLAGRCDAEAAERRAAGKARDGAARARENAIRLHCRPGAEPPAGPPVVTPRETDVLRLASHGLTHAEIAEHLFVSPATVRTHLENVYPKLGVSDKAAAVAAALRHGLID
jgi:DNA-binding CsgD family transcriptional regulator